METNLSNAVPTVTMGMELTPQTVFHVNDIRKWTMFFSIVGIIAIVIMLLVAVFFIGFLNKFMPAATGSRFGGPFFNIIIGIVYLIMSSVYVVPIVFMFNFSRYAKKAIQANDNTLMEKAFFNLRNHYQFVGILTILFMVIYGLILMIAGIAALVIALAK
jgi:hypothetical protein